MTDKRKAAARAALEAAAAEETLPTVLTDEDLVREQRAKEKARVTAAESRKLIKALTRELETVSARNVFLDELAEIPSPKPYKIRKKRGEGKTLPAATQINLASDWHMDERVRPEQVGFKNEYNPDIAQERAQKYFDSVLTMLGVNRAGWDIRRLVQWCGGDFLTGYIHEEYLEENFLSPTEASLLVYQTLVRGINQLLTSDLEHILIPTSSGNHGRTTVKPRLADPKNNYEWMIYQFLNMYYADEPRITFQIANGYNNIVDFYGFRINFHHGDALKGGQGLAGIVGPANKRAMKQMIGLPPAWEGTALAPPHLNMFGHFHQSMYFNTCISNGSLIGWNRFAEGIGCTYEPARQTVCLVDEKYQQINNYNHIHVT